MGNPAQHKGSYTFEEYLALEESEQMRYEFFRGEVYAMSGTKTNHNITVLNVATLLRNYYRGKGCRVFAENIKLELIAKEYYVYPDVMVTCSKEDIENDLVIKEPVILVEVLSKSTAVYDLHTKLDYYLKLPSLLYYLVISQTEYQVKVYERTKDAWTYRVVEGKENELHLNQTGIRLALQEIYEDITLELLRRPS